jgi:diacylglycerol kinase family enzyme
MGRLGEAAGVESFEFQHLVVRPSLPSGRKDMSVAYDGEVARMRPPIDFRVLEEPLYLLQEPPAAPAPSSTPAPQASSTPPTPSTSPTPSS